MQTTPKKRIVFVTGTRADYGKIQSLIAITQPFFDVHIFVTGMHMNEKYGDTWEEIIKSGWPNQFPFYNHSNADTMDMIVSQTIHGFSHFVKNKRPDMIILHGDRPETMACAIVGSFNNILTAHIEGGELSGTIDESIRHSVSKLSHIHFVSNNEAAQRLLQMGENEHSIFTIGSPGMDVMFSNHLPTIAEAKKYYEIPFEKYAIAIFHPVTTEFNSMHEYARNFVTALIASNHNYVIIYPNNDHGSDFIMEEYKRLDGNPRFKIFPSIRHTSYLTLLKNAMYIVGNSSSGIMEAPCYGVPTINVGTRQQGRALQNAVAHCSYAAHDIALAISMADTCAIEPSYHFGEGKSASQFLNVLQRTGTWQINCQKKFCDFVISTGV